MHNTVFSVILHFGFYKAHENVLAACDFATYELLTENGLQREHILFFEDITTREVWCGGVRCNPDGEWMAQIARNQCDMWDGRLTDMTYLIHDRDPLFTGKFTDILESVGCKTKLIPPKTPEYNGYMESFIGSFKRECLNHLILTSEEQLRYVIGEYLEYYNHERPHAGLGGRMIKPRPQDTDGEIVCTERSVWEACSSTITGFGGRHEGFLLYRHRGSSRQMEIHPWGGGIP
jgi:hypothetical protein